MHDGSASSFRGVHSGLHWVHKIPADRKGKKRARLQEQHELTRADADNYTDTQGLALYKGAGRRPALRRTRDVPGYKGSTS